MTFRVRRATFIAASEHPRVSTTRTLVRLARDGTLAPARYKTCLDRVAEDRQFFVLRDLT
jgi:hypothetical protein